MQLLVDGNCIEMSDKFVTHHIFGDAGSIEPGSKGDEPNDNLQTPSLNNLQNGNPINISDSDEETTSAIYIDNEDDSDFEETPILIESSQSFLTKKFDPVNDFKDACTQIDVEFENVVSSTTSDNDEDFSETVAEQEQPINQIINLPIKPVEKRFIFRRVKTGPANPRKNDTTSALEVDSSSSSEDDVFKNSEIKTLYASRDDRTNVSECNVLLAFGDATAFGFKLEIAYASEEDIVNANTSATTNPAENDTFSIIKGQLYKALEGQLPQPPPSENDIFNSFKGQLYEAFEGQLPQPRPSEDDIFNILKGQLYKALQGQLLQPHLSEEDTFITLKDQLYKALEGQLPHLHPLEDDTFNIFKGQLYEALEGQLSHLHPSEDDTFNILRGQLYEALEGQLSHLHPSKDDNFNILKGQLYNALEGQLLQLHPSEDDSQAVLESEIAQPHPTEVEPYTTLDNQSLLSHPSEDSYTTIESQSLLSHISEEGIYSILEGQSLHWSEDDSYTTIESRSLLSHRSSEDDIYTTLQCPPILSHSSEGDTYTTLEGQLSQPRPSKNDTYIILEGQPLRSHPSGDDNHPTLEGQPPLPNPSENEIIYISNNSTEDDLSSASKYDHCPVSEDDLSSVSEDEISTASELDIAESDESENELSIKLLSSFQRNTIRKKGQLPWLTSPHLLKSFQKPFLPTKSGVWSTHDIDPYEELSPMNTQSLEAIMSRKQWEEYKPSEKRIQVAGQIFTIIETSTFKGSLFRAISKALTNSENSSDIIRKSIISEIEQNDLEYWTEIEAYCNSVSTYAPMSEKKLRMFFSRFKTKLSAPTAGAPSFILRAAGKILEFRYVLIDANDFDGSTTVSSSPSSENAPNRVLYFLRTGTHSETWFYHYLVPIGNLNPNFPASGKFRLFRFDGLQLDRDIKPKSKTTTKTKPKPRESSHLPSPKPPPILCFSLHFKNYFYQPTRTHDLWSILSELLFNRIAFAPCFYDVAMRAKIEETNFYHYSKLKKRRLMHGFAQDPKLMEPYKRSTKYLHNHRGDIEDLRRLADVITFSYTLLGMDANGHFFWKEVTTNPDGDNSTDDDDDNFAFKKVSLFMKLSKNRTVTWYALSSKPEEDSSEQEVHHEEEPEISLEIDQSKFFSKCRTDLNHFEAVESDSLSDTNLENLEAVIVQKDSVAMSSDPDLKIDMKSDTGKNAVSQPASRNRFLSSVLAIFNRISQVTEYFQKIRINPETDLESLYNRGIKLIKPE